jgi:two-component system, cell cycle sensor histidine kinase and response regulator CckA
VQHSPVGLDIDIAPDLAAVQADPVQIDQVISNLCVNAVQAMPGGGRLKVTAVNADGREATERASALPFSGAIVRITIADTGGGIPPEVLPRIWEPFFTTKQKGTGLGLATVYAVVKKHDGTITVKSSPQTGTIFTLCLPAVSREAPRIQRAPDGVQLIG